MLITVFCTILPASANACWSKHRVELPQAWGCAAMELQGGANIYGRGDAPRLIQILMRIPKGRTKPLGN